MLLILIIVNVFQHFNTSAAPLSPIINANIGSPLVQECICQNNRSVWDIVWSCLVTIFACSWVSIHPNIPRKGSSRWKKALMRLELMFWSIISPELIITWAARQWGNAQNLRERYKGEGWTMAHGYFVEMGGFILYEGGKPVGVLGPKELDRHISNGTITLPSITEEEIQDRSKGDGLSKAFVIVQTTWFIVQCIARRVRGLDITQLELATVAFAVLNGVMYFLWWNKPLNVECTVPVHAVLPKPRGSSVLSVLVDSQEPEEEIAIDEVARTANPSCEPLKVEEEAGIQQVTSTPNLREHVSCNADGEVQPDVFVNPSLHNGAKPRAIYNINIGLAGRVWTALIYVFFSWPVDKLLEILRTDSIGKGKLHVHTFYACEPFTKGVASVLLLHCIGIIFGGIHCAGWNFTFPSLVEAKIWRVSSAMVTAIPVGVYGFMVIDLVIDYVLLRVFKFDNSGSEYVMGFILGCYILARFALLLEALISLRDLPAGALAVVEWTLFIPHI